MVRIIILCFAVVFTTILYNFAYASPREQQNYPRPIRAFLWSILDVVSTSQSELDRFASGQAGRDVGSVWDRLTGKEHIPSTAVTALNETLTGSTYTLQLMPHSSFVRSRLDGSTFSRTILDRSMMDSASFRKVSFTETDLKATTARGTDFTASRFVKADLSGSLMQSAVFDAAVFDESDLSSVQFSGTSFRHTRLTGGTGVRSIFYRADFIGAKIDGTSLRRASFEEALLLGVVFHRADLTGADFTRADLSGADLTTAQGLTQSQLDKGCGNGLTRLPQGLTISSCSDRMYANREFEPDHP